MVAMRILILCVGVTLLSVGPAAGSQGGQASRDARHVERLAPPSTTRTSARQVFAAVSARVRAGESTRAAWDQAVRELGLVPVDSFEMVWAQTDETGEVRASAYFFDDRSHFFVHFAPAGATSAIPAPLMTGLLQRSELVQLDGGDSVELTLAERAVGGTCQGATRDSITVDLRTARLLRTSVSTTCLPAAK